MLNEKIDKPSSSQPKTEAATCECGKLLADCQCARGEQCECGGDPALCGAERVESIEIALPAGLPFGTVGSVPLD